MNAYAARRYGGWTVEGLQRFHVLYEEVKADHSQQIISNGEPQRKYLKPVTTKSKGAVLVV